MLAPRRDWGRQALLPHSVPLALLGCAKLIHNLGNHTTHRHGDGDRRIAAGDLDVRLEGDAPGELGRLAESINHMAGQLERLEAARTQFISEVAHDLRTPLAAVLGFAEEVRDEIDGADEESAASSLVRLIEVDLGHPEEES
mgnify:CR=1 FL=1